MNHNIFVAGIGTGIGKTVVSAILCNALKGDYWKPVQSGSKEGVDSKTVKELSSHSPFTVFPETYSFREPLAPYQASLIEGTLVDPEKFQIPTSERPIVIEGAGGVLVPITRDFFVIDLIEKLRVQVVLVSKNYLGSINHTLLTIEMLKRRRIPILGIVFNGPQNLETQRFIREYSDIPMLGEVREEDPLTPEVVAHYGDRFRNALHFLWRTKSL